MVIQELYIGTNVKGTEEFLYTGSLCNLKLDTAFYSQQFLYLSIYLYAKTELCSQFFIFCNVN